MLKIKATLKSWSKVASNALSRLTNKRKGIQDKILLKDGAKPFADIPGPKGLPFIGNTFRFLPLFGHLSANNVEKLMDQLHKQYGDIVRLDDLPLKRPIVMVFTPALAQEMYEKEGLPRRENVVECLQHYFDVLGKHGLATSQGDEWKAWRSKVSPSIMRLPEQASYIKKVDEVSCEFVEKMRKMRNAKTLELPQDFMNELSKWALETICLVTLDCRLGCLQQDLPRNHEAQIMIDASTKMFELMYKLEKMPVWKILGNTPRLRQFFQALDIVIGTARKQIRVAKERLDKQPIIGSDLSVIERIIQRSGEEAAVLLAQDMIAGGVDTVANTVGKALYLIATNNKVQAKLFKEVKNVLPNVDTPFTNTSYTNVPYLQCCLKETMRLYPSVPANARTMNEDTVLGGFLIPAKVNVTAAHSTMGRDPKMFADPYTFIPERWLKKDNDKSLKNTESQYAVLPFGYGTRACVARHFANREMAVLIARVVRNFDLQWRYGEIKLRSRLISSVKSKLKLKIQDR